MFALDSEPGYKDMEAAPASDEPRRKANANAASLNKTATTTNSSDDADAPLYGSSRSSSPQEKGTASATVPADDMLTLRQRLEIEKARYPGARTWAPDEARLFELLFFRQELAILPSHWGIDLRGVPISSVNFANAENQPVVYAHGKEFLATTALVRLIELTASIRTTSESGLHHRVPGMIKAGLDRFLAWAAEDGGYSHLRVVPNIITEVVDAELQGGAITALLQRRMRALARLQREFLREDRDPDFWHFASRSPRARDDEDDDDDDDDDGVADRNRLLLQRYLSPRKRKGHVYLNRKKHARRRQGRRRGNAATEDDDELARATPPSQTASTNGSAAAKRRRTLVSPISELDDLAMAGDSSSLGMQSFSSPSERQAAKRLLPSPPPAATIQYRRHPPVVYALFIINTTVFVLTVDSALDDNAYISFHVEIEFMDQFQSVWNALTLAMVSCLARDDMRRRVYDFEPLTEEEEESDPDA
ncbi:hypothetical protein LEL_06685 [Akanthomyces lecanii RCEF 1005]|uniref:Uncharacterized protein n=1 Tax=Akanthomyces lecanii RCEF 1005 TaxID=1081108 RepID=A0A168GWC6_CORDF|nr:hypothetical protein LEL_06685 [Akanthomyces lecanii RCEF 1005]